MRIYRVVGVVLLSALVINHHGGLGDHFICNGLVNYVMDHYDFDRYYLLCKETHFPTVSAMYRHERRLTLILITEELAKRTGSGPAGRVYMLEGEACVANPNWPGERHPELFSKLPEGAHYCELGFNYITNARQDMDFVSVLYSQLGLPVEDKWRRFKCVRDSAAEDALYDAMALSKDQYIFVHDVCSYGDHSLNIKTDLRIINPDKHPILRRIRNIMDFLKVIENAKEVHCVDSSFFNMIDVLLQIENKFLYDVKGWKNISGAHLPAKLDSWTVITRECSAPLPVSPFRAVSCNE